MRITDKKEAFLDCLRDTGNASEAARSAGVSRVAVYQWRSDPVFAARWDDVIAARLRVSAPLARARVVAMRDERGAVVLDANLEPAFALDLSSVDPELISSLIGRQIGR
jgi:hypothetical protein